MEKLMIAALVVTMACLIVQPVIALASSVVFILALVLMDKKD
jgi:hypothetical protein